MGRKRGAILSQEALDLWKKGFESLESFKHDLDETNKIEALIKSVLDKEDVKHLAKDVLSEEQFNFVYIKGQEIDQTGQIALLLFLLFRGVVEDDSKSIQGILVEMDHVQQACMREVFEYILKASSFDDTNFMEVLESSQLQREPEKTPKGQSTSFIFSPSNGTPRSNQRFDSPLTTMLRQYKKAANLQSKEALATKLELDQEQAKTQELFAELQRSRTEIARLRSQLEEARRQFLQSSPSSDVNDLQNHVSKLERQLRQKEEELEDKSSLDSSTIDRLHQLEEQNDKLKKKSSDQEKLIQSLRTSADVSTQEIASLKSENMRLVEEVEELKEQIKELKNIIESLKEEPQTDMSINAEGGECLYNVLENDFAAEKEALETQVEDGKIKVAELEQDREQLVQQMQQLRTELDSFKDHESKQRQAFIEECESLRSTVCQMEQDHEKRIEAMKTMYQGEIHAAAEESSLKYKSEIEKRETQIDEGKLKIAGLEQEKEQLANQMQELRTELDSVKDHESKQRQTFIEECESLRSTVSKMEQDHERRIEAMETKYQGDIQAVAEESSLKYKSEIEDWKAQIEEGKLKISGLEQDREQLVIQMQELRNELDSVKDHESKQRQAFVEECESLRSTLSKMEEDHERRIETMKTKYQGDIDAVAEESSLKYTAEIEDYRAQIEEGKLKIAELEQDQNQLVGQMQELQTKLDSINAQESLFKDNEAKKRQAVVEECESLRSTVSKMEHDHEKLIEAMKTKYQCDIQAMDEESNMKYKSEIQECRTQIEEGKSKIAELEQNREQLVSKMQELRTELDSTKEHESKQRQAVIEECESLRSTVSKMEQDHEKRIEAIKIKYQGDIQAVSEESTVKYKSEIEECKTQIEEGKLKIAELEQDREQLVNQMQVLRTELDSVKAQESVNDHESKQRQAFVEECESLRSTVSKMKQDHEKRIEAVKTKYQGKIRDVAEDISLKYKSKIEECERFFNQELEKKDAERAKHEKEAQEKLKILSKELEEAKALQDDAEKKEKTALKKYEAVKFLLEQKKMKPKDSFVEPEPPKKKTNPDNADFTFKAPAHTPGRSKPGRTQSEAILQHSLTRPPRGTGSLLSMCDEPGEAFTSSFLTDMKQGKCGVPNNDDRLSELARRNSLYPAHLQSTYAAETQFFPANSFTEAELRRGTIHNIVPLVKEEPATKRRSISSDVINITDKASQLSMNSPAANTRSKSRIVAPETQETPRLPPPTGRKRRSTNFSTPQSASSGGVGMAKKMKKEATTYKKPGPATPAVRKGNYSQLNESNSDADQSHDRTPLLDTTNTSNQSALSRKSGFIKTPQSLKKVLTGAFTRRSKYEVKAKR